MPKRRDKGHLSPLVHSIDGESTVNKKAVNVDSDKLAPGNAPGTVRAYSTVFAPVRPGQAYKDIQQGADGKIVPVEGPTAQTWINLGDARRAQHYVATYSQQHIQTDLEQNFSVAQQAAAVGRIMQNRKAQQGRSEGFSSLKTALKASNARPPTLEKSTLFETSSERTRAAIAGQRLDAWGDAGPVIRGFDVDRYTATEVLRSSVVESDKKKTRSNVINVDQTKAANQIGIAGKAKQHLFKGAEPASLSSVVFNPRRMGDRFEETSGKVGSLHQFEQAHGLEPTTRVIARKQPLPGNGAPEPKSEVARRSKLPKGKH